MSKSLLSAVNSKEVFLGRYKVWEISLQIMKDTGNWPSFRGVHAAGVVDEQNLPDIRK